MPTIVSQDTFSYKINVFIKIILIIFVILVINKESLYSSGITAFCLLLLLLKGSIRNAWLKILSKLAYLLIAYLVLDFLFTNDIQSSLTFVGKLISYLLLIVWLKDTSSLDSYLSDVYRATFIFGINKVSKRIDNFFHYFNFYLISTIKLVHKFIESYDKLFPHRTSFINLFIQVFLDTMLRIPETRQETNAQLSIINYRPFAWKSNLTIIILILLLATMYFFNCEALCRNFLSK